MGLIAVRLPPVLTPAARLAGEQVLCTAAAALSCVMFTVELPLQCIIAYLCRCHRAQQTLQPPPESVLGRTAHMSGRVARFGQCLVVVSHIYSALNQRRTCSLAPPLWHSIPSSGASRAAAAAGGGPAVPLTPAIGARIGCIVQRIPLETIPCPSRRPPRSAAAASEWTTADSVCSVPACLARRRRRSLQLRRPSTAGEGAARCASAALPPVLGLPAAALTPGILSARRIVVCRSEQSKPCCGGKAAADAKQQNGAAPAAAGSQQKEEAVISSFMFGG